MGLLNVFVVCLSVCLVVCVGILGSWSVGGRGEEGIGVGFVPGKG